ncbi:MAG TPA: cation-transporting P-type ATPase [Chloroflexota bacterium]|nr:cation-transporting P-type ATPase [Chloroflexota bacterium]
MPRWRRRRGAQAPPRGTGPSESEPNGAACWAALSAEAALAALGSGRAGLTRSEAAARAARYGPNALPRPSRLPWYVELAGNFLHFFALLLWAGAALAWLADMPQLAVAIVAVILVNGLFSYWQEYQAERATEALEALLPRQVMVRRDGIEQLLPATAVVPGDLLVLTEGEAVPADARLVAAERLRVDASALTGESRLAPRSADLANPAGRTLTELPNLLFAGTTVASGRGEAVVFATGSATEFGRIARLTQRQTEQLSPLQRELIQVTRVITALSLGLGIVFFFLGTTVGGLPLTAGFVFGIGIIVANVPEGLLPTLTLALAIGVRRMARRNALVKRLSAVEALGATTLILTDKTGTLTENEMTVREVWAGGQLYRVSGTGYDPAGEVEGATAGASSAAVVELLRAAALCCDAHLVPPGSERHGWGAIGDPTEAAILVAAGKVGLTEAALAAWPRLAELPFDSTRKRMTTVQEIDGREIACVKGAPSEVLPRCASVRWACGYRPFDPPMRELAEAANDELTRRGLRVLAIAARPIAALAHTANGWPVEEVERELTLLGLLAMEDPPRPEVPAALATCRRAGVRVVMVTGDDARTAAAIGREIGLCSDQVRAVSGPELDALAEADLDRLLDTPHLLFARVTPEHKLRLVEAYQRRGEVVAVTGDGVNDAPALKRADIGVAMGLTGTDVAREASDVVLADDNFASIVVAIEQGRAVYDNVRKFLTYVMTSNVAEALPFITFALFHIPLPLTVMQVLAVDLGTDLLPALALGMEPPERDDMTRPPRRRSERLLNLATLLRVYAWLGLLEATFALGGYFFVFWLGGWRPGDSLPASGTLYVTATTMTLAGIVAGQVGAAFACRSARESVLQLGLASNRPLLLGIAAELGLLLLLIYAPPLAAVFVLAPLRPEHWLLLLSFAPLLLLLEEGRKALRRRAVRARRTE